MLQFGEMSGSVKVKRTTPLRMDIGLTPGRRKIVDVSITYNQQSIDSYIKAIGK